MCLELITTNKCVICKRYHRICVYAFGDADIRALCRYQPMRAAVMSGYKPTITKQNNIQYAYIYLFTTFNIHIYLYSSLQYIRSISNVAYYIL